MALWFYVLKNPYLSDEQLDTHIHMVGWYLLEKLRVCFKILGEGEMLQGEMK